jgi:signal transduction histidine kinase
VIHALDDGAKLKTEYLERIPRKFQRQRRDDEGTEIGLTIVRRMVEWHGGRVWVESVPGQRRTFYFALAKRELKETPDAARPGAKGQAELASTI